MADFDPYHKWLGIPKGQRPPTYYQLLGVAPDEKDAEVIEEAAIRQSSHLRSYQTGPHAEQCTRLLNEIGQARATLLNPVKRKEYNSRLPKTAGPAAASTQVAAGRPPAPMADPDEADVLPKKRKMKKLQDQGNRTLLLGLAIGSPIALGLIVVLLVLVFRGGQTPEPKKVVAKQEPVAEKELPPPRPVVVKKVPDPLQVLKEKPQPIKPKVEAGDPPPPKEARPDPVPPLPPDPDPKSPKTKDNPIRVIGNLSPPQAARLSPDAKLLLVWSGATMAVFDTETGAQRGRTNLGPANPGQLRSLSAAFSPDSKTIAVSHQWGQGSLSILNADSLTQVKSLATQAPDPNAMARKVVVSADGLYALVVGNRLSLWNLKTGREVKVPNIAPSYLSARISPEGNRFVVATQAGVGQWKVPSCNSLGNITMPPCTAAVISVRCKEVFFATSNPGSPLRRLDLTTGKDTPLVPAPGKGNIRTLDCSPDGDYLLACETNMAHVIDLTSGTKHSLPPFEEAIVSAYFPLPDYLIILGPSQMRLVEWKKLKTPPPANPVGN